MSLTDRREELLEALGRGEVPACDREELVALVDRVLRDKQARSDAMTARNRARSERIAEGIRAAQGALPVMRGTAAIVSRRIARKGPAAFELEREPDSRTVRRAIRPCVPVSACADGSQSSVHASSTSMST